LRETDLIRKTYKALTRTLDSNGSVGVEGECMDMINMDIVNEENVVENNIIESK